MRWSEKTLGYYGKPPYDPNDPLSLTNVSLRRYNEVIRQVASETGVMLLDIFDRWDKIAAERGEDAVSALLLDDQMHPNTAGQAVVAEALYPILCEKLRFSTDESLPTLKETD
ncbi:MAG: SGNH/GDSL hydrolase family protein [Thermoguttaceae bacterium]|nr:SGNH/GDSL hydrolase family protein [Thermoguttaceae bacterium]